MRQRDTERINTFMATSDRVPVGEAVQNPARQTAFLRVIRDALAPLREALFGSFVVVRQFPPLKLNATEKARMNRGAREKISSRIRARFVRRDLAHDLLHVPLIRVAIADRLRRDENAKPLARGLYALPGDFRLHMALGKPDDVRVAALMEPCGGVRDPESRVVEVERDQARRGKRVALALALAPDDRRPDEDLRVLFKRFKAV